MGLAAAGSENGRNIDPIAPGSSKPVSHEMRVPIKRGIPGSYGANNKLALRKVRYTYLHTANLPYLSSIPRIMEHHTLNQKLKNRSKTLVISIKNTRGKSLLESWANTFLPD